VKRERRCASAVLAWPCVCPSVCHKPVLYRNGWTDRALFWHRGLSCIEMEGNSSISCPYRLQGGNAPWLMCRFRCYINCLFVCLLNFLRHFLLSLLASLFIFAFLLIYILISLLPDLSIYSFENRPVTFPSQRSS